MPIQCAAFAAHRFLVFLLASPGTWRNFSSIRRRRRRVEIIIGAERADYSRTMRASGPINGFLNDHCPGEYPVYIRRGLQPPRTPPGIPDSLARPRSLTRASSPSPRLSLSRPSPRPRGEDEVCCREIKHGCSRFPQRSARIHGLAFYAPPLKRKRECAGGICIKSDGVVFLRGRDARDSGQKRSGENMNAPRDTIFRLSRDESFRLISASTRFSRR